MNESDAFSDLPHECSEALHVMYSFIDGEMPIEEITVVRQHIEGCVSCFEAFDFEAEIKLMVKNKCTDQPPADLCSRIERLIQEADQASPQSVSEDQ